jgi:RimJ/RimL family protein N-acetyltransferase
MIALDKERFHNLIPTLRKSDINTLFAMSVLEGNVDGEVYVDNPDSPASFYIKYPYGMALLYWERGMDGYNEELKFYLLNLSKARKKPEWLQVYPTFQSKKMDLLLSDCIIKKTLDKTSSTPSPEDADKVLEYQRINFCFQKEKYAEFRKNVFFKELDIVSTSEDLFNQQEGSVAPKYFWNNFDDFKRQGMGFTALINHTIPVSTAFSAFVIDHQLEIGIETVADYRGSGCATMVCIRLIDYCLENELEPVWACSSGNIGSRKLALKLGFEESKRIPFYILPIS